VRLVRVKSRVYWGQLAQSPYGIRRHAEYAIVDGTEARARIRCVGRNKWVVFEGADERRFGVPVSPINVVLLRELKEWAMQRYS